MAHTTKENRDIYYRKAKEQGYRARSAYKLLQIFESFHVLYPILDEESALSILLNSSCSFCNNSYNKFNLNAKIHYKYSDSTDIFEGPSSDLDVDTNYESYFGLDDYVNVKRNCFDLGRVKNVVDLCSAPGSWTQLLSNLVYHDYNTLKGACNTLTQIIDGIDDSHGAHVCGSDISNNKIKPSNKYIKLMKNRKLCKNLLECVNVKPVIVAIDLQQMAPVEGVHFLKGDITDHKVLEQVQNLFVENVARNISNILEANVSDKLRRNAQLITCDGAPDVSGLHETDSFLQSSLIKSALSVCHSLLDTDGTFVCKTFFKSEDTPVFAEVCSFFDYCKIFKPPASRPSSFEHFIVAMGFKPMGHMLKPIPCPDPNKNSNKSLGMNTHQKQSS